jgi:hypothetical protein
MLFFAFACFLGDPARKKKHPNVLKVPQIGLLARARVSDAY